MEKVHEVGVDFIYWLQQSFVNHEKLMLILSHLGDPRNAFLLYFPLAYCLHKPTGTAVLWLACVSEWLNAVLKWLLYGERPYWWIRESSLFTQNTTAPAIKQYSLTCETGPGSPSGHAMVTAAVMFCMTFSILLHLKPRMLIKFGTWSLFAVFMLATTISRCFIATHFPHQVLFGTLVGIALSVCFSKIPLENLGMEHYVACSILIPSTCLLLFNLLQTLDLDPSWSITKATKWCQRSEWIHLDTTPFNAVMRDSGSMLGFGFVVMATKKFKWEKESPGYFVKMLHVILSLFYSQVVENFKLNNVGHLAFYSVTFTKFCLLVIGVHFTTMLYLSDKRTVSNKSE